VIIIKLENPFLFDDATYNLSEISKPFSEDCPYCNKSFEVLGKGEISALRQCKTCKKFFWIKRD